MKREEKNALSRQRILEAALEEFANKGYMGASLTRACQEKDLSKGMIYHYFKDKDQLYLLCVEDCFNRLTCYLRGIRDRRAMKSEEVLKKYFDARLHFFAENPIYLGIFLDAVLSPPDHLKGELDAIRKDFDEMNIEILKNLLKNLPLRKGLNSDTVVEDFRMYMNFFNLVFKDLLDEGMSREEALKEHEERTHRQVEMLLYGIVERGTCHGKTKDIDEE